MADTAVPATAQAARDAVRTVAPALIEYTESVLYGDLWSGRGCRRVTAAWRRSPP